MTVTARAPFFAGPAVQGPPRGVRVVVDARPMQEPERSPLTAWYLDRLLIAFAAEPIDDESFVLVSRALREEPGRMLAQAGLPVAGTRRLPPTARALRAAGLTLDSFLLRGAELGTSDDVAGGVFHTAGGAVPIASRLPVVATLLDLAPWEQPETYAASAAARFGHRLRARVLRDASRVIVCSRAVAESARRRLHVPPERLAVVRLAVDDELRAAADDTDALAAYRAKADLPPRYLAFVGRFDARKDIATLLRSLALLNSHGTASAAATGNGNGAAAAPPAFVFGLEHAAESDFDRATRLVEAHGVRDSVRIVAVAAATEKAAILTGAEGAVQPALSDATALGALEALSLGVPVVCSRSGALPETVGSAGIVVEPRNPARMAAALEAMWAGGSLAQQLRRQARRRAEAEQRTWADVARETREVYAAAAGPARDDDGDAGRLRSIIDRMALR